MFVKPVQANVDGATGKTEVLLIGSRQQLSTIALPGVNVGESLITPATAVRALGAVFDTDMTTVPHVNALSLSLSVCPLPYQKHWQNLEIS